MRRALRYAVALLVAGAVTAGVAAVHHSIVLLPGVFVVYALAVAVTLRYPSLWFGRTESGARLASAAFAGGTTFGVLSLAQGLGVEFHLGAGALGLGLALLGAATGVWMADASAT
jgi:hypothetical protein